ncbi:MAG: C-terminal binding protein [Cellulosimicrobium cellulans]
MTADTVVITDCDLPGTACEDTLTAAGLRAVRAAARTEDEVIAAVEEAAASGSAPSALVVQWAPITARVLDAVAGPGGVRMVSRMGIGYDMVDVAAATERGVAVANTPTYCIEEVASHTVAMILTLDRGLVAYDRALRAGTWAPTAQHAARLSSTVVAVIGYGRIGSEVARSARALGYRVLVHDPFVDPQAVASDGHEAVGIDEAVARADVITLHAPLTESTRRLLDARTLAAAKPGVRVVNTCRGPLVDEDALADALASGHVGSAALDVYATEPLPADSPLRSCERILLSPHAGGATREAQGRLIGAVVANVARAVNGEPVIDVVNGLEPVIRRR